MMFPWHFPNVYFLTSIQLLLSGSVRAQRHIQNPVTCLLLTIVTKRSV